MPLSYAAVLGGLLTLIGTSTNLVVSGLLQAMTGSGLGFFDLTWVGLPAAGVAILYFAFVGHRTLPERSTTERLTDIATSDYHFELSVGEGSLLAGKTVEEAGLRALGEAYLAHIIREDFFLAAPCRPGLPAARRTKAPLALGLFGVMMVLSALNVVPLVSAAFIAGLGMIATGCLRLSEARQAVDLPVLLMIAGGYRFADFVRAGLPLNLIVMGVALVMIWLLWL